MVAGTLGMAKQAILYVNERIAVRVGDQLIADHPQIEKYLAKKAKRSEAERRSPTARTVSTRHPSHR